jgi:hypothetical protein
MPWCPQHLPLHRHMAATDQPHIRDRVMRSAKRLGRDHRRSGADEAHDVIDARGLNGLGEGHRWEDGGEAPG